MRFRTHYPTLIYATAILVGFVMSGGRATLYGNGTTRDRSPVLQTPASLLTAAPQSSEHLVLGNPSRAVTDSNHPENYLIERPQYALSYNRDKGIPNWVSWHLDKSWLGMTPRIGRYSPDTTLPSGWRQARQTDYSASGFDRGHLCPLGHRTRSLSDAQATFIMTNIIPLAPDVHRGAWEDLARYEKVLAAQGNELYIVAGGVGATRTIANGNITAPEKIWEVVLVLPNGNSDLSRITNSTRTIAVIIPNQQGVRDSWRKFRVNIDAIESLTGFDFFSNLPVQTQRTIQSTIDRQ